MKKYQHIHKSKAPKVYDLTAAHTQEYLNTNTNYNLSLYIISFKKHLDWKVLKRRVKYVLSMCKILGSILTTPKKKKSDILLLVFVLFQGQGIIQAGLKFLRILQILPPDCWQHRCAYHAQAPHPHLGFLRQVLIVQQPQKFINSLCTVGWLHTLASPSASVAQVPKFIGIYYHCQLQLTPQVNTYHIQFPYQLCTPI